MLQATDAISILLVEDDEDDFLITNEYLQDIYLDKYQLDWFQNRALAIDALKKFDYDIILLDYFIGADNGLELAIELQSIVRKPTPIILLTGQDQHDTDIQAINAGAEDYLVKSELSASLLRRTIRNAITRVQSKLAIQSSEFLLRTIMDTISDGVLTLDSTGYIQTINPALLRYFGYAEADLLNQPLKLLIPDAANIITALGNHSFETEGMTKSGASLPVELTLSKFVLNNSEYSTCIIRDISERKQAQAKIEHQAHYDALTNLPNRRMLMTRLERAIQNSQRHQHYGALLFLDLDRFKHLNDSLGHAVGDMLLKEVANRLKETLRDVDTIARLGGDEFVILLSHLQETEKKSTIAAHNIAKKIQEAINRPYTLEGTEFHFSTSIGIAMFPNGVGLTADDLLKHADSAMYRAKEQGRNDIRFYHPSIQNAANTRLTVEAELRNALAQQQFELHFQPHINAKSELVGCEALIRWNHPTKGLLSPDQFIPIAEECGLIVPIGEWVIENALTHNELFFLGLPNNYMAVNVSPLQFRQSSFVSHIGKMVEQHSLREGQFILELTESTLLNNVEDTISKMQALKKLGVYTSIDDFGTGYSSLSYLKRLPIQQLKIDRSFVNDLIIDQDNRAIVEAVLAMAKHLQIEVIAEGVEDKETFHCLLQRGCEMFQGFYFSKPLKAFDFLQLVQTNTVQSVCNITDYYQGSQFRKQRKPFASNE